MSEQPIAIINADAYWACLTTINELSGKYQVDLCNLSDAAVEKLQSMGISVTTNDKKPEQGTYVTAKSKNFQIKTYDSNGEEITGVPVGNGSKVKAVVRPYDWTFQKTRGRSAGILKLVVTDLVEYVPEPEGGGAASYDLDEAL